MARPPLTLLCVIGDRDADGRARLSVRGLGARADGVLVLPTLDPAWDIGLTRLATRTADRALLADLGLRLFAALFSGDTLRVYDQTRGALAPDQALRIAIEIPPEAAEVAALPWELLHDPTRGALALRGDSIVRVLPLPTPAPPPALRPPLRVLLTGAQTAPVGDVPAELAAVRGALAALGDQAQLTPIAPLTEATLQAQLAAGADVWHFVGHGDVDAAGMGRLLLADDLGDPRPLTAEHAATLVAGRRLGLVVLSACDSGRIATDSLHSLAPALVAAGVPTVVALQGTAATELTRLFAETFYAALAAGTPPDLAVAEGRRAVLRRSDGSQPDWSLPVVWTRALDDVAPPEVAAQTHDRFGAPLVTPEAIRAGLARLATLPTADEAPIPAPGPFALEARMPLQANALFVGRDAELRALARALQPRGGAVAVTTGIGGVGKTQLAAEFAHRYGRFFAGGVFWISCADPDGIAGQIAAYGGAGGLELFADGDDLTRDERCARVQAQWASALPRLIVFDNCDDARRADGGAIGAEEVLRAWKPGGGCRVLVTSRHQEWSPALGVVRQRLVPLERPASIDLLQRLAPTLDAGDADTIAGLLGNLPLALYLAGSYLRAYAGRGTTVAAFIARLGSADLLDHPALRGRGTATMPTERAPHVATVFALSLERLAPEDATDALARRLLARAALLAPGEPFPRDLLMASVLAEDADEEAQLEATDAVGRLLDLGLLEAERDEALRMHRLIAAYAGQAVPDPDALADVERALRDAGNGRVNAGLPADLTPLLVHLRHAVARAEPRGDAVAAGLLNALGRAEEMLGSYAAARPLYERALAIDEQTLGPSHPHTARSLNNLAALLRAQGDYATARPLYERALAIVEQTLGPSHTETAASLHNLAALLYTQGEYAAARPLYERALAIVEQTLGPRHPATAASLNNLAGLLESQGDYPAARPLYERALAIREQTLGPSHPDTAASLNNLALLLKTQGDDAAARPLHERALAIREQTLGPSHPDTATSLHNLAELLSEQGDDAAARPLFERALAIDEQTLGPRHPDTATSLNNLAGLLRVQGDDAAARPLFERALAINEQTLGPRHPDTATSLNNLAGLLRVQGDDAAARPLYERALAIREQTLGPSHPHTATSLNNLALLLEAQGDDAAARPLHERALAIREQTLGPSHPDTATSLHNLAELLSEQGDDAAARPLFERALAIDEQTLGPDHPHTRASRAWLTHVETRLGAAGQADEGA